MTVSVPHHLHGPPPPPQPDRVGLLLEVARYIEHWQPVVEAGTRPSAELISRLNQPLSRLQPQAVAAGFGGLSHHITEFARQLSAGAEASSLRAQLNIVSELAWQARQTFTAEEKARYENPAPAALPLARAAGPGSALAPPPLITIARQVDPALVAALDEARLASAGTLPASLAAPPLVPPQHAAPPAFAPLPALGPQFAPPPALTPPIAPLPAAPPFHSAPPPYAPPPAVAPPIAPLPAAPPFHSAPPPYAPPPAAGGLARPPSVGSWQPPSPSVAPMAPNPSVPKSPLPAAPQFGVKSMLGLRAFNKQGPAPNERSTPPPAGNGGLLSLPGFGNSTGKGKPQMVGPDGSGLPPLAPEAARGQRSSSSGSGSRSGPHPQSTAELMQRMRPDRATDRPAKRGAPAPKAEGRRAMMARGRMRESNSGSAGLWVGLAGGAALLGLGLVAYFTLFRRPTVTPPTPGASGAVVAQADSSSTPAADHDPALPRERLLADNERFTALLAQVHGHGGKETPELRALLNDQAALASKALAGKCKDGSLTCKAWAEVRELMVGDKPTPIVRTGNTGDAESTRTRWMAGLKMPGIPVRDDPRVLRVFEFYTQNPVGRETFQGMLFRCGSYRDLIQATLIRYDMPPDLMALAFTESGCEPSAKSPVGAAGLWQFMPETARAYHLRVVEGTIDERYSPFKSTEASIRMLADLRQKLGDWDLVFASYNLGPFGILARVERAGGKATFWDLVAADLLPDETANYSPTVEAIALILANLQRLKFTGYQVHSPIVTADLEVPGGTRLGVVARAAATSVTELRTLNLDFSGDVVPLIPGAPIAVQVKKDVVWQARDSIKELLASKDGADQCVPPSFDWGKQRFTPDMNAACQRRLAAGAAANPPSP